MTDWSWTISWGSNILDCCSVPLQSKMRQQNAEVFDRNKQVVKCWYFSPKMSKNNLVWFLTKTNSSKCCKLWPKIVNFFGHVRQVPPSIVMVITWLQTASGSTRVLKSKLNCSEIMWQSLSCHSRASTESHY